MNQLVLETAIILEDWKNILELWPDINLKECLFPFQMPYISEELNDQAQILIYLVDSNNPRNKEPLENIIPYLPFCLMPVKEIDEKLETKIKAFQQYYDTPLFLFLFDDENLKEKIAQISKLSFNLPELIVIERENDSRRSIRKLVKAVLDKFNKQTVE